MTFNPSIPGATDDMSDSQGDMLTNFGQLNTVFSEDHVAFNASADKGKHNKVTLVSLGSDIDVDSPATAINEIALFALEDGTDTEIYSRQENNGTVNQITKDGEVFIGMHPVFAINLSDLTPSANITPGSYNFTVNNSYNLDTAATFRKTASKCTYHFAFTNQVVDSSGNPTNKYMWTANGFNSGSNPIIGKPSNTNTYSLKIDPSFIEIEFVNQNNTVTASLTGAVVICWRVQ